MNPYRIKLLLTTFTVLMFIAFPGNAAVWTGAFVFTCNDQGGAGNLVWDTRPGGPLDDVSIYVPGPGPGGLVRVNGPDDYHASINVLLRPGTNVFHIFGQGGSTFPGHGAINLFFDSRITPAISVKRLVGASFTANSSPNTFDMNGAGAPAAGVLEYDNGVEIVKVIDFAWAHGGPGTPNYSGHIAIAVTPKPNILSIRVAEVQICWYSETNVEYQPVYQSEFTTNIWMPFGPPILGTGDRICIRDATPLDEPKRFYRFIRSEH